MLIEVDNREPKELKELLENCCNNLEYKNLEFGDMIIKNDSNDNLLIFERKSLNDLLASIKDNRYSEQAFRLNEVKLHNHYIYYIIEGDTFNYNSIEYKTIMSAIFSISYKKGFSILLTKNITETSKIIFEFYERLKNNPVAYFGESQQITNYESTIKLSKKGNITKNNISPIMLAQIPGIGINVAKGILENYESLYSFLTKFKEDNLILDNLKINNRKLNKKNIENIKMFLL
tara:strand:+ start:314 stop:1012 length:699 start_codon:yes stop_codon:yes gene_type:complete